MAWKRKGRGYWATIDGQQIYLADDKRTADRLEREMRSKGTTAKGVLGARQLLADYADWMRAYKEASTCKTMCPVLDHFAAFLPANLAAESVTPKHVEAWLKTTQCKKPGSFARRITFICGVFNWGVKTRRITVNPIKGMPRPVPDTRETVLPASRYAELMRHVDTCPSLRDFLLFMLDTGARVEEMFKLRCEHFDLAARVAVLPRSKSKGRHRSNGHARVIHLPDTAYEIAVRLVGTYKEGTTFRNSQGGPYTNSALNKHMRGLKKKMDMPGLCGTVLRHSFATHRIKSGQDFGTVAKLMGHKDTTMLYKVYGHLDNGYLASQAQAVKLPGLSSDTVADNE